MRDRPQIKREVNFMLSGILRQLQLVNRRNNILSPLLGQAMLLFIACNTPPNIPPDDAAALAVYQVFTSMATGKIDESKIIYSENLVVLPTIDHGSKAFHDVKFPIEDIRLSPYDPNTQTVEYSCVVPHPGISFWQWRPRDPSELQNIPEGIPMKGRFNLVQEKDGSWKVTVDNNTNPIMLYKNVVQSVNRTWYVFTKAGSEGQRVSGEAIQFNLFMHIAEYSIALGMSDDETKRFSSRVVEEAIKISPR